MCPRPRKLTMHTIHLTIKICARAEKSKKNKSTRGAARALHSKNHCAPLNGVPIAQRRSQRRASLQPTRVVDDSGAQVIKKRLVIALSFLFVCSARFHARARKRARCGVLFAVVRSLVQPTPPQSMIVATCTLSPPPPPPLPDASRRARARVCVPFYHAFNQRRRQRRWRRRRQWRWRQLPRPTHAVG